MEVKQKISNKTENRNKKNNRDIIAKIYDYIIHSEEIRIIIIMRVS